jgi:hypothetical protein
MRAATAFDFAVLGAGETSMRRGRRGVAANAETAQEAERAPQV